MESKTNLCRFIYQYRSNIYCDTPIEIELHQELFLQGIAIDWKVFECIYKITCYTKLRFCRFKFIHRKLFYTHLMFKWKLMENSMCTFCGKEIETLEHMYFNCYIVKMFGKRLRSIFDSTLIIMFY